MTNSYIYSRFQTFGFALNLTWVVGWVSGVCDQWTVTSYPNGCPRLCVHVWAAFVCTRPHNRPYTTIHDNTHTTTTNYYITPQPPAFVASLALVFKYKPLGRTTEEVACGAHSPPFRIYSRVVSGMGFPTTHTHIHSAARQAQWRALTQAKQTHMQTHTHRPTVGGNRAPLSHGALGSESVFAFGWFRGQILSEMESFLRALSCALRNEDRTFIGRPC